MKESAAVKNIMLVAIAVLAGLVLVLGVLTHGFALSVLWGWFVVPVFSVPRITVLQAYGIMLAFGAIYERPKDPKDNNKSADEKLNDAIQALLEHVFVKPAALLLVGLIVKSFM